MYIQRPPSYALAPEEREKNARRSKLLPKAIGPFTVTAVRDEVITIDQDGIRHPVSIDRVTLAHPRREQHPRRRKRGRPRKRTKPANELHVVQKLLARRGPVTRREYLVQWFGHPVTSATWEPAGNLPETMRDRYDQRLSNTQHDRTTRAGRAQ